MADEKRTKSRNGEGSVERRRGKWWASISLPRAPGETKARRKRIPLANSEKMSRDVARAKARKLAGDVRAGRIVFDAPVRKGTIPAPTAATIVRALGEA